MPTTITTGHLSREEKVVIVIFRLRGLVASAALALLVSPIVFAAAEPAKQTVETLYPSISMGPLKQAVSAKLTGDVLLTADGVKITSSDLAKKLDQAPAKSRVQLAGYKFFLLEQMAIDKVISAESVSWAALQGIDSKTDTNILIERYFQHMTSTITISDDDVLKAFQDNKEMLKGIEYEKVKSDLKRFVLEQKQSEAVANHINTISSRHKITVSDTWTKQQYQLWIQNPVEKVRRSGTPSLVDFSSHNCEPCRMLAPIMEKVREKYKGKLNVLVIDVDKEPMLSSVYGIVSIPALFFYDKNGKQVFMQAGFMDQSSIEKRLRDIGVE